MWLGSRGLSSSPGAGHSPQPAKGGYPNAGGDPRLVGMTAIRPAFALAAFALALAACDSEANPPDAAGPAKPGEEQAVPADTFGAGEPEPYAGIGEGEVVHFTGTEPFWGGEVAGGVLTYMTPEDQQGARVAISRFAGRNGVSFSGKLDGGDFVMAVTPGACSDGMSDRTYPFTVTLRIGNEQRVGCAWTDARPFTGPERP